MGLHYRRRRGLVMIYEHLTSLSLGMVSAKQRYSLQIMLSKSCEEPAANSHELSFLALLH